VKLFKKQKSKFYWYDFTVRRLRYRGSTRETKADRASKVAGLKLAQVVEGTDPLPKKPGTLAEFSELFLIWITDARLESQTKRYYGKRLADAQGYSCREYESGRDYERPRRKPQIPRLASEHKLRITNAKANAS
jgi:hypothetical protein